MIYLVALLWLADFKLWVLLDLKTIVMVIFGTALLTMSVYKRGMSLEELKIPASWNAMLTAYLTTFILLFSRLSGAKDTEQLLYDVAMNCRPLLYGLVINILLRGDFLKDNTGELQKVGPIVADITNIPSDEERLRTLLLAEGLTDREIEIVFDIYRDLSNKEIGDKLFITESTVKKHTSNFYKKLNINNREQLKQYIKEH
jgi:DNA-binding CsgD family transcriptional regulator